MYHSTVARKTADRIINELIGQAVYFAVRPNPMNVDEIEIVVEDADAELVAPFLLTDKYHRLVKGA